jgi:hypothetical protein
MKKIPAESAFFYCHLKILIGSSNDSYIDRDLAVPTQAVIGRAI